MNSAAVVTFFMLVTDRDIVIADYSVRSYAKITGVPFKLVVYSNWVLDSFKKKYFTAWRQLPYVEIRDNPEHTDANKPQDRSLYGPFERCYDVWDRELKKLTDTPYHATVDADFEILDGDFVRAMIDRLDANPRLVALSTDYNPRIPVYFDTYSGEHITLNERWQTHFCIYRRDALECPVSHIYHAERQLAPVPRNVWDDTAYFQRALKLAGWELDAIDAKYQRSFIHYAAFVQNRHIDEHNVERYRRVQLAIHKCSRGWFAPVARRIGRGVNKLLFRGIARDTFVDGWAQNAPGRYKGHPDVV